MADAGMEFIDLTLEPPAAASWEVDTRAVRRALERTGWVWWAIRRGICRWQAQSRK